MHPAPQKITFEIAAAVEGAARRMTEHGASELCGSVCSILKRPKLPPSNITKEEKVAMSTLREKDNIVIPPANEGNATVVMDCSGYERKV